MIGAYLLTAVAQAGSAAVFWLIPSDVLRGRAAAVGVAAINGVGMVGSFSAPFIWGVLKDRTGDYEAGLRCLPVLLLLAAGVVLRLRFSRPRAGPRAAIENSSIGAIPK